jgi:hypothetical protein
LKILERILQITIISLSGLLLVAIGVRPLYISHDVSMYLEIGRRILEGQLPYVDYYEINFPIIHYLNVIPAQIALWTGMNVITVLLLCIWLLTVWTIWLSLRISKPLFTDKMRAAVYVFPLCLLLYSHWWFVEATFGQREHLFILLFMPAFFLRIVHWQSETPSKTPYSDFIVGFIAGIAVSIKPHFLLLPIMTELYGFIFIHRSLRRFLHLEVLGVITFGILHILYFLIFPQVLNGLLETIALLRAGYSGYSDYTLIELAKSYSIPRVFPVLCCVLLISWKTRTTLAIVVKTVCIAGLTALAIYFIQGRGFTYHQQIFKFMESLSFGLFVFAIIVSIQMPTEAPLPFIGRVAARQRRMIMLFLLIITPLLVLMVNIPTATRWYALTLYGWNTYRMDATAIIEAYTQADEGVIVIDYQVTGAFPRLMRINRRQSASHVVTYPYVIARAGNQPEALAEWIAILAHDIEEQQPTVIVIAPDIDTYLLDSGFLDTYIYPGYIRVYEDNLEIIYVKQAAVNEPLERE